MPTPIPTYIDEQRRIVIFSQVSAMKFSVSFRPHIRDMDIADAPLRTFMHFAASTIYPLAVTGCIFLCQSGNSYNMRLTALRRFYGKLYLLIGLIDQQLLWAAIGSHALPVDC